MIELSNLDRDRKERKVRREGWLLIQRVNEGKVVKRAPKNFIYFGCGQKRVGATANFPPSGEGTKPISLLRHRDCHKIGIWGVRHRGFPANHYAARTWAIPNRSCAMTRKIRHFAQLGNDFANILC